MEREAKMATCVATDYIFTCHGLAYGLYVMFSDELTGIKHSSMSRPHQAPGIAVVKGC